MKARLLHDNGELKLLICNGRIVTIASEEAREFLLNFDNPSYYAGRGKWDYEDVTIENFQGETIATVEDDGTLRVLDASKYREIIQPGAAKLLTVAEYAEKHGKQVSIIRRFCRNNRIPGAINRGYAWFIPEDAPYPQDERGRKK